MSRGRTALGIAAGMGTASPLVLRRMAREFEASGRLRTSTAVGMYGLYVAHAGLYLTAVAKRPLEVPLPGAVATAGWPLVAAGAYATASGMRAFSSPGQVSGTDPGVFVTEGIYRVTRNPQYLGYVVALAGGALARRSGTGLLLAGAIAGIFAWWVPVEERHLSRMLGSGYDDYLAATRRWL